MGKQWGGDAEGDRDGEGAHRDGDSGGAFMSLQQERCGEHLHAGRSSVAINVPAAGALW